MKVLFATGGTGGHIFPAIETAKELRKYGYEVFFAGDLEPAHEKIAVAGFKFTVIEARGLKNFSPGTLIGFFLTMLKAYKAARVLLNDLRPDKVVGFGGYGSFAVVMAGYRGGYPTMIHEQNVVPGKANRVLGGMVNRIAISFQSSMHQFNPSKVVWTGCPCHDRASSRGRADICRGFGLEPGRKTIVLLGGSQGSSALNKAFFQAMQVLARRGNVQAVHMTGRAEHAAYAEKYRAAGLPVVAHAFINDIEELYTVTDLAVCRAGAATVTELAAFSIPSVLVPYPYAGNHQKYNAQVLADAGAAVIVEQKALDGEALVRAVDQCEASQMTKDRIRPQVERIFIRGAAGHLADAVRKL